MMAANTLATRCSLCSQLYTDPRMLQCLHSFCKKCLLEEQETKDSLKCPVCAQVVPLAYGGVDSLPKQLHLSRKAELSLSLAKMNTEDATCERCLDENPAVMFCCTCGELLCQSCKDDHQRSRRTHTHSLIDYSIEGTDFGGDNGDGEHKSIMCSLHSDEVLKFYCSTCDMLVCRDCIMVGHSSHSCDRVERIVERKRTSLESLKEGAESAKSRIEEALKKIGTVKSEFLSKQEEVDELVSSTFEQLQMDLNDRKEQLLLKSSELCDDKLKTLLSQSNELKSLQNQLSFICDMLADVTRVYTDTEMLAIAGVISIKQQSLTKQVEGCSLEPCDTNLTPVYFSMDSSVLSSSIASLGVVTSGCCPSECTASLQIASAVVDRERRFTVTLRDQWGKPCTNEGEKVSASVTCKGSPLETPTVIDNSRGVYTVLFVPKSCEDHTVNVSVCNQPIKGSPFVVSVHKPRDYRKLSSYQQCFTVNGTAWVSALSEKNELYVAVGGTHTITVFDSSGYCLRTMGSKGNGKGQFNSPSGIASICDDMYVAEYHNHRIQKLNTLGDFVSMFGSHGRGDGELDGPRSLLPDPLRGLLFVSDSGNNRVSVFTMDGEFKSHIRGDETKGRDLNNPWGLAFDPLGHLHVVCYNSHCVKVFTADGEYLRQYGSGKMTCPAGIIIDEEGYSFVTEYGGHLYRLLVFDRNHQLIHTIQNFTSPAGLSMNRDGCVYVADHSNNRVLKY